MCYPGGRMNVLYIAPRYHTNQVPVIKGWLQNGHKVLFISQFAPDGEDYSDITPVILGYSGLFEGMIRIWKKAFKIKKGREASEKEEFDLRIKAGFPPKSRLFKLMDDFKPDLVILRERSIYNISATGWCKKHGVKCFLYNQSPLYDKPGSDAGLAKRMLKSMLPRLRMTPVMGNTVGTEPGNTVGTDPEPGGQTPPLPVETVLQPNSYFVPFIAQPQPPKQRPYPGVPCILCVARYEERKQLFMLVDVLGKLKREIYDEHPFTVTITGEKISPDQAEYYEKLWDSAQKEGIGEITRLLENLPRSDVFELYENSDIFVLPSTRERASIAQLEAMSFSLPVICSDTNGSACYVENGVNGYHFKDLDSKDLYEKLKLMLTDPDKTARMGRESYRLVNEKYLFDNYFDAINKMIMK